MEARDYLDLYLAPEQPGGPSRAEMLETAALAMPLEERRRATFLLTAALCRQGRQEYDDARRCYELAIAGGGTGVADGLAGLFELGLRTGDEAATDAAASELRELAKQRRLPPSVCFEMATAYEVHDQLHEALRWYSIPLSRIDPTDGDNLDYDCLTGRYELRRQLGLPHDRYDDAAVDAMDRLWPECERSPEVRRRPCGAPTTAGRTSG